ncbi:PfkB family carbohydrate kinase [Maridesulfovibrio hydrothermalis]|uniref:Cytidyltransferase-related domain protein n=1 Tax=Maridesulfovibrio hydrothermalis AM13 = DSM 14728 TaxID=1121451 RepID=L0RB58_9BACT|nr:PfkB family carbohydrate kinase [Maridesulfovibrio hydrothermalis]CCO23447.1 Cytidyltransferase-related domain protein [Maridesulfovibrio hydrothermalis AM13 = DSM 14728]
MTSGVENKIKSVAELSEISADLKRQGKKVVLCHGVFDLLHIGHIRYLNQAKEHGDVLMVSLTPDRYVDKGPDRPAFTEILRAEALASLGETDYVTINEWPTAEEILRLVLPDVYAKGDEFKDIESDPAGKIGAEADVVKEIGAELVFTSDIVFSSSNLINRYLTKNSEELDEYLKMFRNRYELGDILDMLDQMEDLKVLVVGDTILDEYQIASTLGKSSKDPILALKYQSHELYAGGALAVANHVANFAGEVTLLSMLGDTDRYEEFIREKLNPKIVPYFFTRPKSPTTLKRRFIDGYSLSKVLEIYIMNDDPLPEEIDKGLCKQLEQLLSMYDLVIVADFGHGLVSPAMVELLSSKAPYLAVNTQANAGNRGFNTIGKYPNVDFFSLAEHELRLEARDQVNELRPLLFDVGEKLKAKLAMVTQGSRGCSLLNPASEFVRIPSFNSNVVDRVGAGDALFSVSAMAACMGLHEELVGFLGNVAGALAVQIMGNDHSISKQAIRKYITATLK